MFINHIYVNLNVGPAEKNTIFQNGDIPNIIEIMIGVAYYCIYLYTLMLYQNQNIIIQIGLVYKFTLMFN